MQVQRDGGKTAMRSVVKTLAGGLGISMVLGMCPGQVPCTPLHHLLCAVHSMCSKCSVRAHIS